jgi:mRNA-degrading endonuclease RelE of RelBE toxin-antitoxin system
MAKKLKILSTFKKDYGKLPPEIREKVDKQLTFLLSNPDRPSLNLHPLRGTKGIWEGYIDYHYRFTFEVNGEFYVLRKVGTHDVIKNP